MAYVVLSELLGTPVLDVSGAMGGRLREVALAPQDDRSRVAALIVRTRQGDRMLHSQRLAAYDGKVLRVSQALAEWGPLVSTESFLLLDRDLLDQQVIDVHGRKVVRVNDVEMEQEQAEGGVALRVAVVDIGTRGAVRRLLKGVLPRKAIGALVSRMPAHSIPWNLVDLIETDPARRVKLRISHDRLEKLHPADIADILEDLAPAEREAIFENLDEEVAAEALEEVDPKLQISLMESLDSDHAADIVEEMDPDAAADLLGDLPRETSQEILEEMQPEEREEVTELLTFKDESAGGRMTTDFIALPPAATVEDALDALRHFEGGDIEAVSTILLTGEQEEFLGAVPLSRIALAPPSTLLSGLKSAPLVSIKAGANEKEVAELFDKYNLLVLPVVDDSGKLTGIITADDVISLLRRKL